MTRLFTVLTLALLVSAPAFAQATPEPSVGDTTDAAISEGSLDRYVGDYDLQPGMILSVTHEADRLFAQATGQIPFELKLTSGTEFSVPAVGAQITFNAASDGTIESLTLNQNGMTITAPRVE